MKVSSVAIIFLAGVAPAMGFSAHLDRLGGGGSAVKPSSYAPGGKSYAPTRGPGIDGFAPGSLAPPPQQQTAGSFAPPPPPEAPVEAPAASNTEVAQVIASTFAQNLGGPKSAAAPVKPASYAPARGKKFAPTSGSGIGGYTPGAAAPAPVTAVAAPATPAASVAPVAAAAPAKPSSYAPGGKKYAATSGSGMGGYSPGAAAPVAAAATPAVATPVAAAAAPGGRAAPVKPSSYAPGGKKYAPTSGSGMGGYTPGAAAPAPQAPATADVIASTFAQNLGSEAAAPAPDSPAFDGVSSVVRQPEESAMIAQEPVLTAINELNTNMVANQEATIGVLRDIKNSVNALADKAI